MSETVQPTIHKSLDVFVYLRESIGKLFYDVFDKPSPDRIGFEATAAGAVEDKLPTPLNPFK
ncbi:unnamed protein product, partial [marine sediment metagenome]